MDIWISWRNASLGGGGGGGDVQKPNFFSSFIFNFTFETRVSLKIGEKL